jgi:DnaJ family protein C protein 13
MYELFDIIEKGVEENADPAGLRTMVLLFPIDFLTMLAREPSKACDLYERRHWSPRLVWDEDSRQHLNLRLEAEMGKLRDSFVNQGLSAIPSWSITQGQPVFLRWTLATFQENDTRPVYKDSGDVDYSRELYLGGFFIDQFLRNPEFDFGISLEERFLRDVRKAIVLGALSQKKDSQELDFDDRRRLLLSLLLLFKLRPPLLLRHSNFDIFFPVFGFISGGSSRERRGLTQVAILLFHCIATHSDIADCMSSDELMQTLASLLDLRVPTSVAGFTGTDPRLCSLMLLLRLGRLSSSAVEVALRLEIIPKLAVLVEKSTDVNLRQRAADCLAVMCADKRKGAEVLKLLEKLMPRDRNTTRPSWNQPVGDIRDEIVDSKTLKHFLQQRYPSSWWVSDSSDSHSGSDTEFSGSVTVVEASLTFSGPSLT